MGLFAFGAQEIGAQEITALLLLPGSKPAPWLDQTFQAFMVIEKKEYAGTQRDLKGRQEASNGPDTNGGPDRGWMRQCRSMTLAPNPVNLAQWLSLEISSKRVWGTR